MKFHLSIIALLILISGCRQEENFENDEELCQILFEMFQRDQDIRKSYDFQFVSKKIIDSLGPIQLERDKENTLLLIAITKKRGWVNKDSLGCDQYFAPVAIFRHSPEEYFSQIRSLIEKEYSEKRMGLGDYWFIDHHLKGRPRDFNRPDLSE